VKKQSENIKLSNVKKKKNNPYLPTHLLIVWVGNAKQTNNILRVARARGT
jgi:hypothetical protein